MTEDLLTTSRVVQIKADTPRNLAKILGYKLFDGSGVTPEILSTSSQSIEIEELPGKDWCDLIEDKRVSIGKHLEIAITVATDEIYLGKRHDTYIGDRTGGNVRVVNPYTSERVIVKELDPELRLSSKDPDSSIKVANSIVKNLKMLTAARKQFSASKPDFLRLNNLLADWEKEENGHSLEDLVALLRGKDLVD